MKEKILKIIQFGIEPERAEIMAEEIMNLFISHKKTNINEPFTCAFCGEKFQYTHELNNHISFLCKKDEQLSQQKQNKMEEYDKLPDIVKKIIDTWDENKELYSECMRIDDELKQIGWTCDFDLSGEIFDVMPIEQKDRIDFEINFE